jgi:hypothetical protein
MSTKADLEQEVLQSEAELAKLKRKYKKLQDEHKLLQGAVDKMLKAVDEVTEHNNMLIDFSATQQDHIQSMYEVLETNLDRVLDTY